MGGSILKVIGAFFLILLVVVFTFFDMPGLSRGHYLPVVLTYIFALLFAIWCFRNDTNKMRIAVVIFVLLFIVCFGYRMPIGKTHVGLRTTTGMSEIYPDVYNGTLEVSFAGGNISLILLDGGYYRANLRGKTGAIPSGGIRDGRVHSKLNQPIPIWWANTSIANDWTIEISPEVSWDISMKLSRSDGFVDLSVIPINRAALTVLNTDLCIKVPYSGVITINAIASRVEVLIPDDATISVESRGFLCSDNLNELGWNVLDGAYIGPSSNKPKMKLYVSNYISSIQLTVED
jgi:hypothetical protein